MSIWYDWYCSDSPTACWTIDLQIGEDAGDVERRSDLRMDDTPRLTASALEELDVPEEETPDSASVAETFENSAND